MDCKYDDCELKKTIDELTDSQQRFQAELKDSLADFKGEVHEGLKEIDNRATHRMDKMETDFSSGLSRVKMSSDARYDKHMGAVNGQFIQINKALGRIEGMLGGKADLGDVGEIRGMLGGKADASEIGELKEDVTQSISTTRTSFVDKLKHHTGETGAISRRVMFIAMSFLLSTILFLLGLLFRGGGMG